jgi:hypothetical protein
MTRFIFGVIIGILLTLYFQAKGGDFLRGIGIDPQVFFNRFKVIKQVTQTFIREETPEKGKELKKPANPQKSSSSK